MPWASFGHVRCIHMRARVDRMRLIEAAQKALNIPLRLFYAEKHAEGGVRGCYESHVAVMREALADGQETCLVFEDDLEVGDFSWERLAEVTRFIRDRRGEWDVVYLGCFPDVWSCTQRWIKGNIFEVHATQTHAYVVSKAFMERMVARPFDGTPIDEVFYHHARAYAVLPSLFFQASTASDVSSVGVSLLAAKRSVTDAAEVYAVNVGLPLRTLVLAFLLACVAARWGAEACRAVKNGHGGHTLR